jgi:hypothetical protein
MEEQRCDVRHQSAPVWDLDGVPDDVLPIVGSLACPRKEGAAQVRSACLPPSPESCSHENEHGGAPRPRPIVPAMLETLPDR